MRRDIQCPRCGKTSVYAPENPFRPFCSERCQLIDLGEWASEKYAIPVQDDKPPINDSNEKGSTEDGEI